MSDNQIRTRIRSRIDLAENWNTKKPVLLCGEIGIEVDSNGKNRIKVGDGKTTFPNLSYVASKISVEITSQDRFQNLLSTNTLPTDVIYVLSDDYVNLYSKQIKNLRDGTDDHDAATIGQVSYLIDQIDVTDQLGDYAKTEDLAAYLKGEYGTDTTTFLRNDGQWISVDQQPYYAGRGLSLDTETRTFSISDDLTKIYAGTIDDARIYDTLSVLSITPQQMTELIERGELNDNSIYQISNDNFDFMGERGIHMADGIDYDDAVTLQQLWGISSYLNSNTGNNLVHKSGNETITGYKTFTGGFKSYSNLSNQTSVNKGSLELYMTGGCGGFIDFHFNGSTSDYTSRIIENGQGQINIDALITTNTIKFPTSTTLTSTTDNKVAPLGYLNTPAKTNLVHLTGTETITGDKTFSGTNTFSNAQGFNYTGIETGSSDVYRTIWYSDSSKIGKPVINTNLQYNPSSRNLKVGNIILSSDTVGTDLGNGVYSYCAVRGDALKNYVQANSAKCIFRKWNG